MHPKYWNTLEYPKILARLAEYTSFSAGRDLVGQLTPSTDPGEVQQRQRETTEARRLLDIRPDTTLGGARDVRPLVHNASLDVCLDPKDLLSVRNTLVSARRLKGVLLRLRDSFPLLAETADLLEPCPHIIEEINRCISEQGEVMDSASPALARIRREMNTVRDRLLDRLNKMITSPEITPYLQDSLVTLRGGRYVIPLRSEFKGRIQGIIHDQSSSGATLFIEPLATVEMNNRWRELQLEEEREVERILRELSGLVSDEGQIISRTIEGLAQLDLAFAKARYSNAIRGVEPRLIPLGDLRTEPEGEAPVAPADIPPGVCVWLREARHPLLPAEIVVPIDIHLGGDFSVLLITGPNTGGKTVTLKTVGLLALMTQAGLHLPAREDSALAVFEGVYADIGDEQSIEQNLSTFSSHMTTIIDILERADERSLVLLDELGAGTDPVEGTALARAILGYLLEKGAWVIGTTHYSDLKLYAHSTPRVENASVEFDLETLAPTYKVTIGLPGRSNAFAIADRLGLKSEIIQDARRYVSDEELRADKMLADIKIAREEALVDRDAARAILRNAQKWERELREKNQALEEARAEILNAARAEARRELEQVQKQLRKLSNRLSTDILTKEWLAEAQAELEALTNQVQPIAAPVLSDQAIPELAPGDLVWVPSVQQQGELLLLDGAAAEVGIGRFRVRVRTEELEKVAGAKAKVPSEPVTISRAALPTPSIELELRGMRVEEVLPLLEKHLNDAYLAGLPWVRIVHGKGTGTLRRIVREQLAGHPLVAGYREGEVGEGGAGVTVAQLVRRE